MKKVSEALKAFVRVFTNKRSRRKLLMIPACIVVFCTTYALILPAITLDTSRDTCCGVEEHVHTDACYETAGTPGHKAIVCACSAHQHEDSCYNDAGVLVCGRSESIIHQHNEYCFDDDGELICELPEVSGEYHTHTADCYDSAGALICGKVQMMAHQHTASCVGTVDATAPQHLICTKSEHTHSDACYLGKSMLGSAAPQTAQAGTGGDEADSMILNKEICQTSDGRYVLKMESYVTGHTVQVKTYIPQDIVLVLDVSGSMAQNYLSLTVSSLDELNTALSSTYGGGAGVYVFGTAPTNVSLDKQKHTTTSANDMRYNSSTKKWQYYTSGKWTDLTATNFKTAKTIYISRFDSMKIAVNTFLDEVNENSVSSGVKHRVSLVKFSGYELTGAGLNGQSANVQYNRSGTTYKSPYVVGDDLYYDGWNGMTLNSKNYSANYSQIVTDLSVVSENIDSLKSTVNNLTAIGGTFTDIGMMLGQHVLSERSSTEKQERQSYLVLFTDGEPGMSGYDAAYANRCLSYGNALKTDKDSPTGIYTVGCQINQSATSNVAKFMNYLSSNYPTAKTMSDSSYTKASDNYYKLVTTASEMSEMFAAVIEEIGETSVQLDESTVLNDGITSEFVVATDKDGKWDVIAYTMSNTADGWLKDDPSAYAGVTIDADIDAKRVKVSGFDYAENWVSTSGTPHGRKLVVEIPIDYAEGSSGALQTNTPDSGIYSDDKPVGKFEQPTMELPSIIHVSLKEINQADQTNYPFTISHVSTTVKYAETPDVYDHQLTLTGFGDLSYNLADGDSVSLYARDDSSDGVAGNDPVVIKQLTIPDGYTVKAKQTVHVITDDGSGNQVDTPVTSDLDFTINKTEGTLTFYPVGTVDIEIIEDYTPCVDLTLKPTMLPSGSGSGVTFHYVVTCDGYNGEPVKEEFDLKVGETKTLSNIPRDADVTVVESGNGGYYLMYYDATASPKAALGSIPTCGITMDVSRVLEIEHTAFVTLPSTGSSGRLILTIVGGVLIAGALIGFWIVKRKKGGNTP